MAKKKFRTFKEAKKFVHKLKLPSERYWREFRKSSKLPTDIPSNPNVVYKNKGWLGYPNWLGYTSNYRGIKYRSYEEAKKFVHKLKLPSERYWREFVKSHKLPTDIPSNPNVVYKNKGWLGYPNWLGNKNTPDKEKKYRSYEDAKKFVHKLKLKSRTEWEQYCKSNNKPGDIPMNVARTYKNKGWIGLSDWLGHTTVATNIKSKNYLPWLEAKKEYQKLAKQFNITNLTEWRNFFPKHKKLLEQLHLPESPWLVYTKERVWKKMK